MMDQMAIAEVVAELKGLRAQRDELDKEIEKLETQIKDEMTAQDTYEFLGEGWKVTWKMVSSNRFDQSGFKEVHPDLFEKFKKLSESRRFTVS